ncbi:hypothetical protein B296_00011147 [Ensete ventricosum]|uniref:Uncharacterized protein n=1 Tax=Ensete ventricosum TaxID=4639 RepID=A0A427B6L6_ENSVE|nr:hypothetical protein B296_00011147 [Ensete ventricosum]
MGRTKGMVMEMRRQRGTPPTLHAHRNGKGSGTVHLGDQERRHGSWREDFGDRVASSLHRRKAATRIKITATVGKRQGIVMGTRRHRATPPIPRCPHGGEIGD